MAGATHSPEEVDLVCVHFYKHSELPPEVPIKLCLHCPRFFLDSFPKLFQILPINQLQRSQKPWSGLVTAEPPLVVPIFGVSCFGVTVTECPTEQCEGRKMYVSTFQSMVAWPMEEGSVHLWQTRSRETERGPGHDKASKNMPHRLTSSN